MTPIKNTVALMPEVARLTRCVTSDGASLVVVRAELAAASEMCIRDSR